MALRDCLKSIRRDQPEWFSRVPEATRREAAISRLSAAVRESLNLPDFELWSRQNAQMRIF